MTTYTTYALFNGPDDSILLINPYLKNLGFQFHKVSFKTAQLKFHDLFGYVKKTDKQINFEGEIIDYDFYQHIQKTTIGNFAPYGPPYFILLSPTTSRLVDENLKEFQIDHTDFANLQRFIPTFLGKLRLFKEGDLSVTATFEICEETGHISVRHFPPHTTDFVTKIYSIHESELKSLIELIEKQFYFKEWSQLAMDNFELYYDLLNNKIKFTTLITVLECLFNFSKEQIAHTISRHASIICSSTADEFQTNYKRIKKLYNIRNSIIHGSHSINPSNEIDELEEYACKTLRFVLGQDLSKEELFEKLNKFGFDK